MLADERWSDRACRVVAIGVLALAILLVWFFEAHGRMLYPGQFDAVPQQIRDWFVAQLIPRGPHKGESCCSNADGVTAEEDIRGNEYWVRFRIARSLNGADDPYVVEWMRVPDDAVLTTPNLSGAPRVWHMESWIQGEPRDIKILCYAPGPKM